MAVAEEIATPQSLSHAEQEKLRMIVAKIERLEEEKAQIAADIKDVYAEAKALGYETKPLRKVISMRKQDRQKRAEEETWVDLYLHALGEI